MEQALPDEVLPDEVPISILLSKRFWSVLPTVLTNQYVDQVGAVRLHHGSIVTGTVNMNNSANFVTNAKVCYNVAIALLQTFV